MGRTDRQAAALPQTTELLALADQLEKNLAQLDALGAHLAAAHLDTAICRIRADAQPGAGG
jgi:hypothetical protein